MALKPSKKSTIYKQKCFLHLIQQPKYEMVMPCKADYSPAKSFYDVKNLSGLIYLFPITKLTWRRYGYYGWQLTHEDEEIIDQGYEISRFFEIYKNSF